MCDFPKLLQELKSRSLEVRLLNIQKLVEYVEDTQDLHAEVTSGISKLVMSSDQLERITGLCALIRLCEVANEANLNTLACRFIQNVSVKNILTRDDEIISLASTALGVLVSSPTTTTFELAEEELNVALKILRSDLSRDGQPRYHACCEIKEIALKLPIIFAVYLGEFLKSMWNAIKDPKEIIRRAGVEAFDLALHHLENREDLLENVYGECLRSIQTDQPFSTIHGCLLTLHKMVTISFGITQAKLREIIEGVFKIKDHKHALVRQAAMEIIPSLTELMNKNKILENNMLELFLDFLFRVAQQKELKAQAFRVLGQMAVILGENFDSHLKKAVSVIEAETRKKPITPEVFELLRGVILALGGKVIKHFEINLLITNVFNGARLDVQLLDCLNTLNSALVQSTDHRSKTFVQSVCEKLLGTIRALLSQRSDKPLALPRIEAQYISTELNEFSFDDSFEEVRSKLLCPPYSGLLAGTCYDCTDHAAREVQVLSLFTLSNFPFRNSFDLSSLVHTCVLKYLEDPCAVVRKHAVITTCALLKCPKDMNIGVIMRNELYNIIERMLNVALTDPSEEVRCTLFKHLKPEFFVFLASEGNLSRLMVAVNDASIQVRKACVSLLGRLANYNGPFILPCLTQLLSQYITTLRKSTGFKQQQDAAILIRALVVNSKQLLSSNLGSIVNMFLTIIDSSQNAQLVYQAMNGVSACAEVCKGQIVPFFDKIFNAFIENLKDPSAIRRKGALKGVFDVVTHTTLAIEPYLKYDSLLDALLDIIKTEERVEIRKLAEKALGKIGALDPVKYKEIEKRRHTNLKSYQHSPAEHHLNCLNQKILELTPSQDIYYPLVAIKALLSILIGSHSVSQSQIGGLLHAVRNIFKSYTSSLTPLLEDIIPILVHAYKQPENTSKERFLATFREIASIVGEGINDHISILSGIIDLSAPSASLVNETLTLLRELATHSCYETMNSFPELLHHCIRILSTSENNELIRNTLAFFRCLKGKVDQYLYITVPSILKIIKDNASSELRKLAAQVIAELCDKNAHPHIVDYISRIVDTFISVIKTDSNDVITDVLDALSEIVLQLNNTFAVYIPVIQRILVNKKIYHKRYEAAVQELILATEEVESPIRRYRFSGATPSERPLTLAEVHSSPYSMPTKREVNVEALITVCNTAGRHTKEEWKDWIRRFASELLKQAPASALRECQAIEEYSTSLELFNAAFVSCWSDLYDEDKNMMIKYLESAFDSPSIPTEVLQVLLNLAEFMEHDDHKLFDARTLWKLAYKCKAYAKALHYKEVEFYTSAPTSEIIESLISLNNLLNQHEAAYGIRVFAQKKGWADHTQNWLQEFHRWQDAEHLYGAINERLIIDPQASNRKDLTIIRMKCLRALSDWIRLLSLAESKWQVLEKEPSFKKEVASHAAAAAWNLGDWDKLEKYTSEMDVNSFEQMFYMAILNIRDSQIGATKKILDKAWELVDARLPGLIRESYSRAYPLVIECQQLCDLEEVIQLKEVDESVEKRADILRLWTNRLRGCQPSIDIWEKFLSFRPLLFSPENDLNTWIEYTELCMKNGQKRLAGDTLDILLYRSANDTHEKHKSLIYENKLDRAHVPIPASVCFLSMRLTYKQGFKAKALNYLTKFVEEQTSEHAPDSSLCRYYLQLASWQKHAMHEINLEQVSQVLASIETACKYDPKFHKAWHKWGIMNFEVLKHLARTDKQSKELDPYIKNALKGFIHSISLEYSLKSSHKLQNLLRLVTLWFDYGTRSFFSKKLKKSFEVLNVEVWLQVIPQIIARSATKELVLKEQIVDLLRRIAKKHPHALVYPLTMATRTNSVEKLALANTVMKEMQDRHPEIVKDTLLVTNELIRCSVLWREQWEEAISDASQVFFGAKNIPRMFAILRELHQNFRKGPQTINEIGFYQAFAADLLEAETWLDRYERLKKEICIHQAWNIYYNVYMKLSKIHLDKLELPNASHELSKAENLCAHIPGTYKSDAEPILISKFKQVFEIFQTKQHPKKLSIMGSNGKEYQFLLKGREDIRQDERAMQLFGLVNDLLAADRRTNGKDLAIRRYAVVPLSPTCGLIGWVHGCDTLNQLIQEYRQRKRIETFVEKNLIKGMYGKFENLPITNKIEIFEFAMTQTKGEELQKILWSKSSTSEVWLERRTNYTRSLATMSMVGYVLGLGDRHPSNLMLDRYTGKIVHIDFGDCFEVAMKRERCPERVPFRLTRMLVNAMEISGTEGNFRNTCEQVMEVLRMEKDSLMAMLEVFLYEPLVSWRILNPEQKRGEEGLVDEDKSDAKAIEVLNRILQKLTGRDFPETKELTVTEQVDRLIKEARSIKNLAQSYIGWCPFW